MEIGAIICPLWPGTGHRPDRRPARTAKAATKGSDRCRWSITAISELSTMRSLAPTWHLPRAKIPDRNFVPPNRDNRSATDQALVQFPRRLETEHSHNMLGDDF